MAGMLGTAAILNVGWACAELTSSGCPVSCHWDAGNVRKGGLRRGPAACQHACLAQAQKQLSCTRCSVCKASPYLPTHGVYDLFPSLSIQVASVLICTHHWEGLPACLGRWQVPLYLAPLKLNLLV